VTETLTIDRPQPGVVVLQLNRPGRLNAINELMRDELTQTLATIGADASTNVVVLTGAGRGFCSGYRRAKVWVEATRGVRPGDRQVAVPRGHGGTAPGN